MATNDPLLEQLASVWNDPGRTPWYHGVQKQHLRDNWPLLYDAVDRVAIRERSRSIADDAIVTRVIAARRTATQELVRRSPATRLLRGLIITGAVLIVAIVTLLVIIVQRG